MTIAKLAFQFFMMNIEHKMKLKLTIVIGFGAKIWIQSPNLFQKFQQVWRQLHSLSIVDYPKLSMLTTLSRFNSKYEIKVNVKDPLPLAKEQVL